jgi:hypothetical protein
LTFDGVGTLVVAADSIETSFASQFFSQVVDFQSFFFISKIKKSLIQVKKYFGEHNLKQKLSS